MGIDDERSPVEVYYPWQKIMDDRAEELRKKFGSDWANKIGLRVIEVPPTIDENGNEVGGMDDSFFRPPSVK